MHKARTPLLGADVLPGPTGESNLLSLYGRGVALCLGPTANDARKQAAMAEMNGCAALAIAPGLLASEGLDGRIDPSDLEVVGGFDLVVSWGGDAELREMRRALAARSGVLIPLVSARDIKPWCVLERHICIDTTAAGGNAALLAAVS